MTIKAMEQAIEALNEAVAFREGGRQKAIDAITALRTAIQQAESEPVLFVSPEQARAVTGKNRVHYTPSDNSGRYLPVRATPAGLFVQPLYTHPAPGVQEGYVIAPIEPTDEMISAACQDGVSVDGRPVWKHSNAFQAKWKYQQMLTAAQAQKG